MNIKNISGEILYESQARTLKAAAEEAVAAGVDLSGANFRNACLNFAELDGAHMPGACFWGARLNGANLSDGDFRGSDFRTAILLNACMGGSDFDQTDFSGAFFARTIIADSVLSRCRFSCPSIFSLDLGMAQSLQGSVYNHFGERECNVSTPPIIIQGLTKPVIWFGEDLLIGHEIQSFDEAARAHRSLTDLLRQLKTLSI